MLTGIDHTSHIVYVWPSRADRMLEKAGGHLLHEREADTAQSLLAHTAAFLDCVAGFSRDTDIVAHEVEALI